MTANRLRLDALGTVVGIWAHPDDEAFLSAGLMASAIDRGVRVVCVTATRGERGTADPVTWPPERLGRRRTAELRASLAALGVRDHRALGYVDGALPRVPTRGAVRRLVTILDEVRADTVVTFGPEGMTGHPDHVTVSRWATLASQEAAVRPRLLYATTTAAFASRWRELNERLRVFGPGLPLETPDEDVALALRLDGDVLDRKVVALAAQSSQLGGLIADIGEDVLRAWWSVEAFSLGQVGTSGHGLSHEPVAVA